jgi:cell division septation protein DedD
MKRVVLIVGGIVLALVATGVTWLPLAFNNGNKVAAADDGGLLIPTLPDDANREDICPWNVQERRSPVTMSQRNRSRGRLTAENAAADGGESASQTTRGNNPLVKVVFSGLAGVMAVGGLALIFFGLRNRLPKRRKHRQAYTAMLAQNAGQRKRRMAPVPATISISLASQHKIVRPIPASQEPHDSPERKEVRRAA